MSVRTRRVVLKETDSFVCVPFTKLSFSGKDALAESFGLTNGETELGRVGLTPDSRVDLGVVTTPDTLLERDVVSCGVAMGEEIDTSVTADECSVIEELLAVDTSSRDGLSKLSESLADDESRGANHLPGDTV